jgi:hypothetical protein
MSDRMEKERGVLIFCRVMGNVASVKLAAALAEVEEWEAEADRLKAALTEYNLHRVFWKHTVDADLNTDEGCTQAAQAVVAYIAALAPADRNSKGDENNG